MITTGIVMNFSAREGYKQLPVNQLEEMGSELKNQIFNEIYTTISNFVSFDVGGYNDINYVGKNAHKIWTNFFNKKISTLPEAQNFLQEFENLYNTLQWYEIYDFIEFLISIKNETLIPKFNQIFEKNNSPYRFINKIIQPISSDEIVKIIDSSYKNSPTKEVKNHLMTAEKLFSRRNDPEFNSSALESIKAIESCLRYIFNNQKILGDNIKSLKKDSYNRHLISILEKINAFRGDVSAHATKPDSNIPAREDAILIHCMCCSFINYFMSFKSKSTL